MPGALTTRVAAPYTAAPSSTTPGLPLLHATPRWCLPASRAPPSGTWPAGAAHRHPGPGWQYRSRRATTTAASAPGSTARLLGAPPAGGSRAQTEGHLWMSGEWGDSGPETSVHVHPVAPGKVVRVQRGGLQAWCREEGWELGNTAAQAAARLAADERTCEYPIKRTCESADHDDMTWVPPAHEGHVGSAAAVAEQPSLHGHSSRRRAASTAGGSPAGASGGGWAPRAQE